MSLWWAWGYIFIAVCLCVCLCLSVCLSVILFNSLLIHLFVCLFVLWCHILWMYVKSFLSFFQAVKKCKPPHLLCLTAYICKQCNRCYFSFSIFSKCQHSFVELWSWIFQQLILNMPAIFIFKTPDAKDFEQRLKSRRSRVLSYLL